MTHGLIKRTRWLLPTIAFALLPGQAWAQTGDGSLEEIIVTATKRSESLQDVPISIGVVGGETIEKYDIRDLTDLQGFVPGLNVTSTFGNWAVRIRGLGSGQTNLAFDSSVSIFKDGVYCGRSRCLEQGFRLEIRTIVTDHNQVFHTFVKKSLHGIPQTLAKGFATLGLLIVMKAGISGPICQG